MKKRPNILFMLSDDHGVQAISALNRGGVQLNRTPNLDRLADAGAIFRKSYCCNSICTPSRASILTGKHSYQNGVLTLKDAISPDQVTFAGLLKQAGYSTALVGKWHLHSHPKDSDFDFWQVLPGQGSYHNPDYITKDGTIRVEGYSEDITTDTLLDWLDHGRDPDKPFLACLHFKAPHRPWMPPERHYHLYDGHTFPEPSNLRDDYANRCGVLKKNEMELARHTSWTTDFKVDDPGPNACHLKQTPKAFAKNSEYEFDRMTPGQRAKWDAAYASRQEEVLDHEFSVEELESWTYQTFLRDYLGCIQAIDDNVGRVLDYLDERGLTGDTIVVYCSDQGFYLGEHRWFDKRWMFEESMLMPLMIRWPGRIQPGTVHGQLVQNIDYAPTLLEACGVAIPEDMQGASMLRVIENGAEIHDELYYHYYMHFQGHGVPAHDGVRTQRHKLIHFYSEGVFNLFDMEKDPKEMQSVHDDPAYADVLADMKRRYEKCRHDFQVPDEHGAAAFR